MKASGSGPDLFTECIKPFDLALMQEADSSCVFNILHICDIIGEYDDLTPFLDYPGHVINFSHKLGSKEISGREVSRIFDRPFMGGMERSGVIASGASEEIRQSVEEILAQKPDKLILGADCTLPGEVDQKNSGKYQNRNFCSSRVSKIANLILIAGG